VIQKLKTQDTAKTKSDLIEVNRDFKEKLSKKY